MMRSYHKILICLLTGMSLILVFLPFFSDFRLHKGHDIAPQVPRPQGEATHSSLNSDFSEKTTHHETFIDRLAIAFTESLMEQDSKNNITFISIPIEEKASIEKIALIEDMNLAASYEENNGSVYLVDGRTDVSASGDYLRTKNDLHIILELLEKSTADEKEQAILSLWIVAADLGVPEEALASLEYFLMQKNEREHVELAEFVLTDLRNLKIGHSAGLTSPSEMSDGHKKHEGLSEDLKYLSDGTVLDMDKKENEIWRLAANFQKQINSLGETALGDPDERIRKKAIQAVSTFRAESSVDVLLSAAYDSSPSNRYLAIQALWLSAIDGGENEREEILRCLQQASADTEDRIADLATMALDDIEKHETEESHAVHTNLYDERSDDEIDNMHTVDGRDI